MSMGGVDRYDNLWPLDDSENSDPKQYIDPKTGKDPSLDPKTEKDPSLDGPDQKLGHYVGSGHGAAILEGRYFIIKGFK
jgi:hypothetical protein